MLVSIGKHHLPNSSLHGPSVLDEFIRQTCAERNIGIEEATALEPLQDCMRRRGSPIDSVPLHEERVMLTSNVEAMLGFLVPEAAA